MSDENKYTRLIAGYHVDRPKYRQMVFETTQPVADIGAVAAGLPADFDLDSAVGVQLDAVGVRVGITRRLKTPLAGVYFSFDIDGVGFDMGVWQGPYDPDSGITILDDDAYREILRIKIANNHWDGTLSGAVDILAPVFGDNTQVFIIDNSDMSIDFGLSGEIPDVVKLTLLFGGYITLKPAGVRINGYFVTSEYGAPIFGFDADNEYLGGFDHGAWGDTSLENALLHLQTALAAMAVADDLDTLVNITLPAAMGA